MLISTLLSVFSDVLESITQYISYISLCQICYRRIQEAKARYHKPRAWRGLLRHRLDHELQIIIWCGFISLLFTAQTTFMSKDPTF